MIIPMRCFTCNKLIADKYEYYLLKKKDIKKENLSNIIDTNMIETGLVQKTEYGKILDEIGLHRYCCRRMFLGQVDIIEII
jgi:DNA-directed RNA polymerase subunit N (RpoN/RPB10)